MSKSNAKKTNAKATKKTEAAPMPTALQIALTNANAAAALRPPSRIENVIDSIDKLRKLSPFYGNRAHSSLCYTLGMFAINALSWKHYETTRAPLIAPSTSIDIFNDGLADQAEQEASDRNVENIGLASLPKVDGLLFCGVYKQMLAELTSIDPEEAKRLMPDVIFSRIFASRNEEAVESALDNMAITHANVNNVKVMLEQEMARQRQRQQVATVKIGVARLDFVLHELRNARRESFSDDVWKCLPLYKQYQMARNVLMMATSATAAELRKPVAERTNEFDLIELMSELKLELDSARQDPEVKLAYEVGRLTDDEPKTKVQAPATESANTSIKPTAAAVKAETK